MILFGGYLVLALPLVAAAIAGSLPSTRSSDLSASLPLDTLVIFDGDNRRGRVRETMYLYSSAAPKTVWVLGQRWLVDALAAAGIPPDRLAHDTSTATTRDQIAWVQRFQAEHPTARLTIVASRLQLARVDALVRAAGLRVALAGSPADSEPPTAGGWRFVPTYFALRVSRDAIYEHAALTYYRWRGWIN